MNDETKVGIFVLTGLLLLGTAIFLLGDYSLRTYYTVYVEFNDVAGLPDKAVVKLSGVDVGKIKRIYLKDNKVCVQISVLDGVKIYKDAKFLVGSTSIIGSKFLEIDQGSPAAGKIRPEDHVSGEDAMPLDRALARTVSDLQGLVKDLRGDGSMSRNLNDIISNLREVTANINEIVSASQPHAEKAMERLDAITAKLDDMLAKTGELVDKINKGEGTMGALISDKGMKDDVSGTINNLKDATASVKDVLGRINGFKTYWNFQWKYEPLAGASKSDIGLKIYPRDNRYYYVGGANIINTKDTPTGTDYENKNTIDALMGWEMGDLDIYAGALRGSGGVGVKYKPFRGLSGLEKMDMLVEVSELTRNRTIKGRSFNSPRYDAGMNVSVNKYVSTGFRLNDLAEIKRFSYTARILFEDKDISYLFGMLTFGSSGIKGRSASK